MPKVLIAGGSGLIGQRLSQLLSEKSYAVAHLSRRRRADYPYELYQWDVDKQEIDVAAVEGADYIINLAGAGIVDKRWTNQRKKVIIESRTESTRLLLKAIKECQHKPKAYISGSAIGYYGDRGNELLTETSPAGKDFLAESTTAWEAAVQEVAETGIRTAYIRIGIVLSTQGGALPKMLIPFYFFLGTYFGNGRQWHSWVHIDDLCQMFIWAMEKEQTSGAFNGVSPRPLTNKDLTLAIGRARDQFFIPLPAPAFILRLGMGEMVSTILNSSKVSSQKAQEHGFEFAFPEAETAVRDVLKRKI